MNRDLLSRLDAGDDLHKEAAAHIREMRKQHQEEMREAARDAQAAYSEGKYEGLHENDW